MSLDANWETARDEVLETIKKLQGLLKFEDSELPENFDEPVTESQMDALKRWELQVQIAADDIHSIVDDLTVSGHIKAECQCVKVQTQLRDVMKPVGFEQGVTR